MTPTEKAAVDKVHKQLDRLAMARQQVSNRSTKYQFLTLS